MELVTPAIGLVFWMVVSFGIVFFLLKKYAWKPILDMLKERETSIQDALDAAQRAKQEMANLKSDNERILMEARNDRDIMLKEARETREAIISEAKTRATIEADRLTKIARENIHNEKMAAITELKNQVAVLSIEIAEKVIRQHLSGDDKQKALIADLLKDVKLN